MQSRRREDYRTTSPSSKHRSQHRHDVGHESHSTSRRKTMDHSPRVHHQKRSLSPPSKIEGSRRATHGEGRSGSAERRDYGWHLGGGRSEKVRSGSPKFVQECKRPHFDERVVHRKYDGVDNLNYDDDDGKCKRVKEVYGYDHHGASSRVNREKNYIEERALDMDAHGTIEQKLVPHEDRVIRGSYRAPPELVPASEFAETGGLVPLPPRSTGINQFEHEKLQYQERLPPLPSEKRQVMEFYKEEDKPMFHSREVSYTTLPRFSKGFQSPSHHKNFSGPSSGVSRSDFPSSYGEGASLLASGQYPRGKVPEPMNFNAYGQRSSIDIRDHEAGERIVTSYPEGAYSPHRVKHDDYFYPKSQRILRNDHIYPSDCLHKMMPPHSHSEYDHCQTDCFVHRELPRPSAMHPVSDRTNHTEDSYGNMRRNSIWDHPTIQKEAAMESLDESRMLYTSNRGEEYVASGYNEFGRRQSGGNEISPFGMSQDHQVSYLRSDYGFGRDAGPQFQGDRLQDRTVTIHGSEMCKFATETQRTKDEVAFYEPSDKMLKRKTEEEDVVRHDRRTIVPSKWHASQEFEYFGDTGEEWVNDDRDDASGLPASRIPIFNEAAYKNAKRVYHKHDREDFASGDQSYIQDSQRYARRPSLRYYKPGVKYMKGHPKSSSLSWYNSRLTDERSGIHRQQRNWQQNDDYDEDTQANNDGDLSADLVNFSETDRPEDSEEFKQLIDEAFLLYSKQLNLNPGVRRRYREQGKAGSLFCIVCGRSSSKEFLDTQRLVTHAFMCHKVGLRAQHLGLHKAVCVLMGWSSFVPYDTITWVPEVLPKAEALAQKEDLMLWPPLVIIHNISMSNNNPEKQKVVPIEGVQAFLRVLGGRPLPMGKGFVTGKVKVSLGKPADQSVMLVKFLGTFTGLGSAERLHEYFSEKKHGREDFERKTSTDGESTNDWEEGMKGDKLEEHLLYGYMGIAEDLDKLDYHTKKWILIKSKKDIQDLADDPVKPDDR